jgi:hypothetical protein
VPSLLGTKYVFATTGNVQINIAVDKHTVSLPVDVRKSPVLIGASTEEIIAAIGLPSHKKSIFVSWPDSESIDGMFYNPTAGQSSVIGEHWRYEKYPGLVLAIRNNSLQEISSDSEGIPQKEEAPQQNLPEGELRTWTS